MVLHCSYIIACLFALQAVVTPTRLFLPHRVSRNLALNKPAWQSSTHPYDEYYRLDPMAALAVDGDTSSMYSDRSCTHTLHEDPRPWWTVDLLQEYMVTEVVITNRGDCCADRLSNFNISVGNSFDPDNKDSFYPSTFTQCAHIPGQLITGETRVIQCNHPVRGRYVTVNLNKHNPLTICEFQVHGTPVTVSPEEISQEGTVLTIDSGDLLDEETMDAFVCEHETLNISCPANKKIEIISANCGRTVRLIFQIKDETGKLISSVISIVHQPSVDQNHPPGNGTYLLLVVSWILFLLLFGVTLVIDCKCAGYSCNKKQMDLHDHSSGHKEAEKPIDDLKTVYRE